MQKMDPLSTDVSCNICWATVQILRKNPTFHQCTVTAISDVQACTCNLQSVPVTNPVYELHHIQHIMSRHYERVLYLLKFYKCFTSVWLTIMEIVVICTYVPSHSDIDHCYRLCKSNQMSVQICIIMNYSDLHLFFWIFLRLAFSAW